MKTKMVGLGETQIKIMKKARTKLKNKTKNKKKKCETKARKFE